MSNRPTGVQPIHRITSPYKATEPADDAKIKKKREQNVVVFLYHLLQNSGDVDEVWYTVCCKMI